MPLAITRAISDSFPDCQLTHLERQPIDLLIARQQHRHYQETLRSLGCRVVELPADDSLPDCVFVEDTALVLPEVGVILHPGAASRRPETVAVTVALAPYRKLLSITAPGTLEGGDILVLGKIIYVGLSSRSNPAGIAQLAAHLQPYGYQVVGVELNDCLHLKSAITQVSPEALLVNRLWVDVESFQGWRLIDIHPAEPFGANALRLSGQVIYPSAYVETASRLEFNGLIVLPVDVSELAKAEGGVTCCSLIFEG
jgi:dimethylargininase